MRIIAYGTCAAVAVLCLTMFIKPDGEGFFTVKGRKAAEDAADAAHSEAMRLHEQKPKPALSVDGEEDQEDPEPQRELGNGRGLSDSNLADIMSNPPKKGANLQGNGNWGKDGVRANKPLGEGDCEGWRILVKGIYGGLFTTLPVVLLVVAAVMALIDMDTIGDYCALAGSVLLVFNRPYAVWTMGWGWMAGLASIFAGGHTWATKEAGKPGSFRWSMGGLFFQIFYFLMLGASVYFAFIKSDEEEQESENKEADVEAGKADADKAKEADKADADADKESVKAE